MIVVLKREATEKQIEEMIEFLEKTGIQVHRFTGTSTTVLGLIGDTSTISSDDIEKKQIVESVKKVQTPYKRVSRSFHNTDSVIEASGIKIGGENFAVIAGPCAVENEDQIIKVAKCIKDAGGSMLRGGAFKPRTSPYSFQGLELEGLELLKLAKKETGLIHIIPPKLFISYDTTGTNVHDPMSVGVHQILVVRHHDHGRTEGYSDRKSVV